MVAGLQTPRWRLQTMQPASTIRAIRSRCALVGGKAASLIVAFDIIGPEQFLVYHPPPILRHYQPVRCFFEAGRKDVLLLISTLVSREKVLHLPPFQGLMMLQYVFVWHVSSFALTWFHHQIVGDIAPCKPPQRKPLLRLYFESFHRRWLQEPLDIAPGYYSHPAFRLAP